MNRRSLIALGLATALARFFPIGRAIQPEPPDLSCLGLPKWALGMRPATFSGLVEFRLVGDQWEWGPARAAIRDVWEGPTPVDP